VLGPFVLIRASLVYRGRAIPRAWKALRHASAMVSFEAYQPVLEQVRTLLPTGSQMTVLADRGFLHEQRRLRPYDETAIDYSLLCC
jgi:hypothetical protein